jgi:2-keto-3-deoxy-L-rhamnonate aldolase RhmA
MKNLDPWKQELYHKPLYGCFVTFASPAIAEFTAMLGFDFLLIDNEHGNMDMSTVEDMVRASQCVGVPAVVRATHNSYEHVQKALDMGANGVQIPLINTPADAKKAFQLTHFPPVGNRGTAYLTRAAGYGLYPDKQGYLAKANETKLVSVHIETLEAVNNLDKILDVAGLDVFFIGPGDLSSSMGLAPGHPEVLKVVENCIRKIRAKGKIAGTYTGDVDSTKQAVDWGANYIVTAITSHMAKGAQQFLQALRK